MLIKTEWYLKNLALSERECLFYKEEQESFWNDFYNRQARHYREMLDIYINLQETTK